jgi:hypothetical protein
MHYKTGKGLMDNIRKCGKPSKAVIQPEEEVILCPVTVYEEVCMQAQVTIIVG